MFETIAKGIGVTFSTVGVALQGLAIGADGKSLVIQIVAIACTGIGAGALAMTGKLVGKAEGGGKPASIE
jgi:hypothetical protein